MAKGGFRANAGRHKDGCNCPRCIANAEKKAQKQMLDELKNAESNVGNQNSNTSSASQNNAPNDSPESQDKQAAINSNDSTGNKRSAKKSTIDFSAYKSATTETQQPTTSTVATTASASTAPPQQAPTVVISGTVLLAVMNFVTPELFKFIAKFLKQDFSSSDFRLEQREIKSLEPAANAVAEMYFKNLHPLTQLLVGYTAMSWTRAMLQKSIREKAEAKK